jgi:hypothetical protein
MPKQATAAKPAPAAPIQYPKVDIGDVVYWYHGNTTDLDEVIPVLALVTAVYEDGQLELAKLPKDNTGFQLPEGGVRHRSDPMVARMAGHDPEDGFWVVPPGKLLPSEVEKLRRMMAAFSETAPKSGAATLQRRSKAKGTGLGDAPDEAVDMGDTDDTDDDGWGDPSK